MEEPTKFTESNILLAVINGDEQHAEELIKQLSDQEKLILSRAAMRMMQLVNGNFQRPKK